MLPNLENNIQKDLKTYKHMKAIIIFLTIVSFIFGIIYAVRRDDNDDITDEVPESTALFILACAAHILSFCFQLANLIGEHKTDYVGIVPIVLLFIAFTSYFYIFLRYRSLNK